MKLRVHALALALGLASTSTFVGLTCNAIAGEAEERGLAIAKEIKARNSGFGDTTVTMTMTLKNKQGQTSSRSLETRTLEMPAEEIGDKSLTLFHHPRDVKGTAFLSHTKILEPDDQWLFLPALKRVKRISSSNKSGPFVGSEFAYEDLASFEVGKYSYVWLRDEPCPDDASLTCAVVERIPLYKNSGYTKQVSYVDLDAYRIRKLEFYDRKNVLLKTMVASDFRQYLGRFWRAHSLHMTNHQTGKETTLVFSDFAFQTGIKETSLTPNRLKRIR